MPRSSLRSATRSLCLALGILCACASVSTLRAQFTYSEDFRNSTAPGWVLNPPGNSATNVLLTSGAAPRTGDPENGTSSIIDPTGSGWMRLTNNTTNTHNAVYFDTPIPSAGNSVTVQFGVNLWGGNNFNGTGADGLTFFLFDASKPFQVGADGGSMGYAQKTGVNGLNGGFVAVALDAYGNFSVQGEGRQGGTATLQGNSVAVRGPGQGTTGYDYLAGTGNRDYTDTGSPTTLDGTDGTVPALPYTMAFPTNGTRPNQSTQYRNVSVTIDQNSQLSVSMQFGEDGLWYNLLNVDISSFVRPEQLKMGFSAGTGSGTIVTEVGGLLRIEATAGSGNFVWDNGEGAANRVWGTGANNPLNWAGNTNPTLKSNVLFNGTYVTTAQNIDVTGSDKVIQNLYFSGTHAYTLGTTEARKLIFDSNTVGGVTSLNLTNDAAGNTSHTIALDVQMNKNLDINNNIAPTFTISGNIDNGGNTLGLKGGGTTVLSGAISGAGGIVKSDAGTTILSGAAANTYTGTTTIDGGTLQIEKATALGSTASGTLVNSGGTLALAGTGTTFAAESLIINGDGVSSAGALRNLAGTNTWTGTIALGTTGSNAIGVDSGTNLTLSGVVSGVAGNNLTKVGDGTLALTAANTYAGATRINAGTLAINTDASLGTAPGVPTAGHLTLDGGTLQNTATLTLNANRGIALGASGGTLDTSAGTTLTYNGVIAGAAGGDLNKSGAGTLALGGVSTYNGATNITGGTLQLGINNALPTGTAVNVSSGASFDLANRSATVGSLSGAGSVSLGSGTLTLGGTTDTTYSGAIAGSGNVAKTGSSTLTLSGTNTFTGALTVGTGSVNASNVVTLGASNALADTATLALNGGLFRVGGSFSDTIGSLSLLSSSTIDFAGNTSTLTFTNATRTAGTLTIDNWSGDPFGAGASQLRFTSAADFTAFGGTNINFNGWGTGSIRLASGEIVPNTGGTIYTYALTGAGNWNVDNNWSDGGLPAGSDPGTFASAIGDTAIFGSAATGPATINLNGANRTLGYLVFNSSQNYTITGNNLVLNVNSGLAQITNSGSGTQTIASGIQLADALNIQNNGSGALNISGGISNSAGTNNITVNGTGTTTLSGNITTGTGTLTKSGSGTLTLGGTNTYSGGTTVADGTVRVSADANLGAATGAVALNGGTLENTATLTLAATRSVTVGAAGGTFDTNSGTTLTYNGTLAGSGTLTKADTGTLSLGGTTANTHSGNILVQAGTLDIAKNNTGGNGGIGDTAAVTIDAGATLRFNGGTNQTVETIGSLSGAGTVNNAQATALVLTTGGNNASTEFSGVLQDGGGNLSLTKVGSGTLTLSGANSHAGTTTVTAGALNIQNNTALGAATSGTSVAAGAALELQHLTGITVTGEALTLNGTGIGGNGALRNLGGANSWTGGVTLGSAVEIQSDSGSLTISGGIGGTQNLTIAGAGDTTLSGIIATGTGTLTKNDAGTLTLANANTYTGATTINAGTVQISNATALGTTAAGTTIANGATLALSGAGFSTAEAIGVSGQGVSSAGAIRNVSGNNSLTGTLALNGATYIGVDGSSILTTTNVISGANDLTKVGTGTLVLNGSVNNTYTGTTAVNAGTLEIRQAGQLGGVGATTITDGATLRVNGSGLTVGENVTLVGQGVSLAGALQNTGGNNTWSGNLTMAGDSTIGATAGTTLTSTGTLAGAFNLTKVGDGGLTLSGANSYAGTTTVRNGTLTVSTNAPVSANGALGSSNTAVQLGDTGTAAADNLALLIGNTTGGISLDRGIVVNTQNTSGTTTLGGTNTSGTNTFAGGVTLNRSTILTAAAGGTVDFTGGLIGTGGITKTDLGIVTLSGNNNYSGATVVSGGVLAAANSNALGSTPSVSVASGASLAVSGGITLPGTAGITLNGAGIAGIGALVNGAGDNTVAGNITLGSATSLGNVAAGSTMTLTGTISGAQNLTTVGTGNITLAGNNTNSGTFTLNGSGDAVVTAAATSGSALGSITNLTVNTGNVFALGASNQINDNATLTLAGGTFSAGGFSDTLRSVTQTASSTIDFLNDGSVLRFNGVIGVSSGLGSITGTMTIANWAGSLSGSGTEQIVIYSPTAPSLTGINFSDWGTGNNALAIARPDLGTGYYELVPLVTAIDWNVNGSGTWTTNGNWVGGVNPNAAGAIARFGNLGSAAPLTTDPTVNVTGNRTVNKLIFDNSANRSYTISSSNGSRVDLSANAQVIVNDNGSHVISTGSRMAGSTVVTNNSAAAAGLTLSGNLDQRPGGGNTSNLTFNGDGNTLVSGSITQSTGTTNLVKTGSGVLTLANAANDYIGTTTVRNGTLEINANAPSGAAGALGNATSAVIVNDASTTSGMNTALLIGASGVTVGRTVTVGAQGATTTLGGDFASGTGTFSGAITLNKSVDLTAAGTSVVNFNGQFVNGTGVNDLTKVGTGTVVLGSAANNYTGATTINAGTLRVGVAGALPDATAVTVNAAGTLDVNSLTETIGSLAGAGNVILGTTGTTTLTTGGNQGTTTVSGVISGAAGNALLKTGTGTMTVSGANTYAGATTVNAGTLIAASNSALGSNAAGTTVAAGATLGLQGAALTITGEQLNLAAATSPGTASLANLSGTNLWTGSVSLTGGTANDQVRLDAAAGSVLTISGAISEATNAKVLAKTGAGTTVLSGNNTYTGSTNITAGTLVAGSNNALGSTTGGTSVQIGATLGLQNNVTIAAGEAVTLYSVASPSSPSLRNLQDSNTLNGAITLSGGINTGVVIEATGGSLTLNGAITQASNPNSIVKTGSGSVTLGGTSANTFSGGFTINEGTVIAAKTAGVDATGAGAVNIGDGTGAAGSAVLQLNAGHQINNASNVTIATDGRLDLQGNSDTVGSLTMSGGAVTGSGTLALGGNLTFNGVGTSTSSISSNVDLGTTGTRIVQVGNNGVSGDADMVITGTISGGTASFNKTDFGTLQIAGTTANTFSGTFQVSDGTVQLNKTAGLNATGTGAITVGDGAGAANTASLRLLASNQINDGSRVTVLGDGRFDVNGLNETIGSFAGTGTIDTGAGGLLITGGDNTSTTFGGALAGTGVIRKTGTGDLTFNSNINFAGGELNLLGGELTLAGVAFNVGTLRISGNTVLDFGNSAASVLSATNVIIENGATLTITNWVHNTDFFYATGSFYGLNTTTMVQTPVSFNTTGLSPQNQIVFTGFSGNSTQWTSYDRQITPAPEPATYGAMMIGAALGCLGLRRWRQRKAARPTNTTA